MSADHSGAVRPALRVAALVDLEAGPAAGGHVKCWERLAAGASDFAQSVDLTVYMQGRRRAVTPLAANARIVCLRPVLSTARFRFLDRVADHSDLAPCHPGLFAALRTADVIHTTDAHFAYARTARLAARLFGRRLVHSLHTDTVAYVRHYFGEVISRVAGDGPLGRRMRDRWRLPDRLAARMAGEIERHVGACAYLLTAERADDVRLAELLPPGRTRVLRRGVDKRLFHPCRRDRAGLAARFGIPADRPLLAFAGRVDAPKRVMTLARAARTLLDRGVPLHVAVAGQGPEMPAVAALLGPHVTLLGVVPQTELAVVYASAELFVFPSVVETAGNVVLEAKASGLPVLVAPQGTGHYVRTDGIDGVLVGSAEPAAWAEAAGALLADPARRAAIATAARHHIETDRPDWAQVVAQDLLPIWQAAAQEQVRDSHVWPTHPAADTAS